LYLCHRLWSPRDEFLKQWLGVFPIPDLFGRAIEVAALNVVHVIVPILIQQRHRQLNVLRGPVMRPFSDGRICGYHVIQRREPKPSGRPRLQLDAEVLGVSVRCAEHPEQDLRSHEGTQVSPGIQRLLHDREQRFEPRAAFILVFYEGRRPGDLAKILLYEPKQSGAVGGRQAVKAFDDENPLFAERGDTCFRGSQAVRLEQAKAQPLVVH